MKKQDQATAINESNLKDPHQVLPDEMFCRLLSFLSPSDIAISSAVSRDWRISNLSDSTLYSEIDLSEPSWTVDEDQNNKEQLKEQMQLYILHFTRLSCLALHRLVKVSINLACFLPDFKRPVLGGVIQPGSRLYTLLLTLDLSESSLKEVSIQLNYEGLEIGLYPDCLGFCSFLLKYLGRYSKLKKLEFEVDLSSSLEAVHPTDGKSFVLRKGNFHIEDRISTPSASALCSFIKEATGFVGSGLTRLSIDDGGTGELGKVWCRKIIPELLESRETLKTIYMDENQESFFNTTGAWNLLMSCPNLRKCDPLRLNKVGEGERISTQEAEQATSYRQVILNTDCRWDSMLKWIGNGRNLEILELWAGSEEEQEYQYDPSLAPLSLGSILHSASRSLKELVLYGVRSPDHPFLLASALPFPNLETLRIDDGSPHLWSSFSELRSSKLRSLEVSVSNEGRWSKDYVTKQRQECFDCLVSLMKNPTLSSVRLDFFEARSSDALLQAYVDSQDPTPQSSFVFTFPQLQTLEIDSPAVSKWFSRHHYPNLQKLRVNREQGSNFKNIPSTVENQPPCPYL